MPRFRAAALLFALCLALLTQVAGCRREVVAPGDPVAAVRGMADALRQNDLVRYSRLSIPPALYQRVAATWRARRNAGPAPTDKQRADYAKWMQRLTAADAERALYRDFNAKMRKFDREIGAQWPLMQATGGMLANGLIQSNADLSPAEKSHAKAVSAALLGWMTPQLLSDRPRAEAAIKVLVATARRMNVPTLEAKRQLDMVPSLEKAGLGLAGLKQMARIYGLDMDASLAALTARLVSAQGDRATVEVSYPLLGQTVRFDMELLRRDGRWYSYDAVSQAEADLAKPLPGGLLPGKPTTAEPIPVQPRAVTP
ncbi:hypothetical protein BH11PSE14_BH11PSE14_07010 [soil metagenome]